MGKTLLLLRESFVEKCCTLTNCISEVSSLFNSSCISSGVKFTLILLSRYDCNLFSLCFLCEEGRINCFKSFFNYFVISRVMNVRYVFT